MLLLSFILISFSKLRYLQLQSTPNLYVTNIKGSLSLAPPGVPSYSDQEVFIKKRVLYFSKNGTFYTIALPRHAVVLEAVQRNVKFKVGYLQSKAADIFGLRKEGSLFSGENRKGSQISSRQQVASDSMKSANVTQGLFSGGGSNLKKFMPQPNPEFRGNSNLGDFKSNLELGSFKSEFSQGEIKTPTIKNTKLERINQENSNSLELENTVGEPKLTVSKRSPENFYTKQNYSEELTVRKEKHMIESDSSMDELGGSYTYKEVKVHELDEEKFLLKANPHLCVTFYKGEFILAACNEDSNQIFTLTRPEFKRKEFVEEVDINEDNFIDDRILDLLPKKVKRKEFYSEEKLLKKGTNKKINTSKESKGEIIKIKTNNEKITPKINNDQFKIPPKELNDEFFTNEMNAIERLRETINDKSLLNLL